MNKKLDDAYSLNSIKDTIELYKSWSNTYDQDFALNNNYQSPLKVVKYFLKYYKIQDTPILDVGAGTGLIGEYLKKYISAKVHAIDISKDMLDKAKQKKCYEKIIIADLNDKLQICNNTYGAILSAGTFTLGHLGPNVLNELLRIIKPGGIFVISIHKDVYIKNGFNKAFEEFRFKISNLNFHKVNIYGKSKYSKKRSEKVFITIFRKKY